MLNADDQRARNGFKKLDAGGGGWKMSSYQADASSSASRWSFTIALAGRAEYGQLNGGGSSPKQE